MTGTHHGILRGVVLSRSEQGPEFPAFPGQARFPARRRREGRRSQAAPAPGPAPPTRVWVDPHAGWQDTLHERLLEQRIVLASGVL